MNIEQFKIVITKGNKFLSPEDATTLRLLLNEVYLQDELHTLVQGLPLSTPVEDWRASKMELLNKQLATVHNQLHLS